MEDKPQPPTNHMANGTLYQRGIELVRIIQDESRMKQKIDKARETLTSNGAMRACLMGLPTGAAGEERAPSLQTVLQFHHQFNGNTELAKRSSASRNKGRTERRMTRQKIASTILKDPAILGYISKEFPEVSVEDLLDKPPFVVELIGTATLDGDAVIRMETIFARLAKIERAIQDGFDLRKLKDLGRIWIPKDKMSVLMEVEAKWQRHFLTHVCKAGYLDEIAGVSTSPGVQGKDGSEPHIGSGQARLLRETENDIPSGGVVEWSDYCFSPRFIQYFHQDVLPSINFMADPDSPHDRFIRCEAPAASSSNAFYFQLGKPPRARLFRAIESSKFGDALLRIANYVESERELFFYNMVKFEYGEETAKNFVPPKKNYDILYALVGDSSFAYHTDSAEMLCHDGMNGWSECFLRVVTFFFQVQESQATSYGKVNLKFRPRQSKTRSAKEEIVLSLSGPHGMHEQANFNQSNWEHTATHQSTPKFRRLVFTARATGPLQSIGLERLRGLQPNLKIYGDNPRKYRIPGDQVLLPKEVMQEFRIRSDKYHQTEEGVDNDSIAEPIRALTTTAIKRKGGNRDDIRKAIRFHRDNNPSLMNPVVSSLPRRLIQVSERLTELLTSAEGQEAFMKNNTRLLIETGKGLIPFGPPSNFRDSTCLAKVGDFFPTHVVRKYYELPDSATQRPPWDSTIEGLSSLHLSKAYKAPLLPTDDGMGSPMGEMLRIQEGGSRRGFAVYLSGGNSTPANAQGPTVDRSVITGAGDSTVVWKTPKRMSILSNPRNRSLYEVALMDRVLAVWLSGQNLPIEYQKVEGKEMSMYAGLYHVDSVDLCKPWTAGEVKSYVDSLPSHVPRVQVENLSFLRCRHLKCKLLPFMELHGTTASSSSCWKDMVVKSDEPHQFCFEAQESFKAEDLTIADSCLPPIHHLVDAFLHHRLNDTNPKPSAKMNDGPPAHVIMCNAVQTKYQSKEVIDILKRILVSYNMRLCWLNVDDTGENISTLRDDVGATPDWGSRYSNLFGSRGFGFCRALGSNVTTNPYPCPFPAGDAKVLYLMQCNQLGHESFKAARDSRDGLAYVAKERDNVAWFLVQSFITETTGNPVTNRLWWDKYCSQRGGSLDRQCPRLPHTQEMLEHYVSFLKASTEDRKGMLTDFWQGHYHQDRTLMNAETFGPALMRMAQGVRQFVDKIVDHGRETSKEGLRQGFLMQLASFLATCMNGVTNIFLAGRVMANFEELVGHDPFGPVDWVPFGTGALHGAKLVDWQSLGMQEEHRDKHRGDVTREWVTLLLKAIKAQVIEDDWYGYLYIDEDTGNLHQAINGRQLNAVDIEHFLCKVYIYREHEPGGGRCTSHSPSLQRTHCFPMKRLTEESIGSKLPSESLIRYRCEYIESGIQYLYMREQGNELAKDPIFDLGSVVGSTPTVFTNDFVTRHPLPKHRYRKCTFVNKSAWERQAELLRQGNPHINMDRLQMKVLEDGPGGLQKQQVHWYDDKKLAPLLDIVKAIEAGYGDLDYTGCNFSDTFTMHEQIPDCSDMITAFYYHVDVPFAQGRIVVYPLQGDSWMLVSSSSKGLALKDDSTCDFNRWKSTLDKGELESVEAFVENFRNYALKRHGQPRLNIYRNRPGRAMAFDGTELCHGVIVPKQPKGKPRKALLFHRLELY